MIIAIIVLSNCLFYLLVLTMLLSVGEKGLIGKKPKSLNKSGIFMRMLFILY